MGWNGNGYKPGEHYGVCQSCGLEVLASKLRRRWDGLLVCPDDWEPRHPQEFVRGTTDKIAATGNVSPEPPDVFVTGICTTRSAKAGCAVAGCAIAGLNIDCPPEVPAGTFSGEL